MEKFPEIEQFRHVLRNVAYKSQFQGLGNDGDPIIDKSIRLPVLKYEGTVKIHGSCSSVVLYDDKFVCQSRNREISIEKDNSGFAKFIHDLPKEVIHELKTLCGTNVVVHGEWAGKGIHDTVAVSQLPKFWSVFGIKNIGEDEKWKNLSEIDLSPLNKYNIFNIRQFGVFEIDINFDDPANDINKINELTLKVEEECPVGKFFGISGIGEGIVWRCKEKEYNNSRYVFKTKGEKHSKSKVTKLANVDVEKLKNIRDFVKKHVNEERLNQAWNYLVEMNKPLEKSSTPDFLRWIFNDIIKEESDELEASGLNQKDVGREVSKESQIWFFNRLNSLL